MCPGPGGARANRAADLNKTVSQHAAREMPGLGAYGVIRLMQDNSAQARPARVHNQRHEERLARQARHGIGGVGSGGTLSQRTQNGAKPVTTRITFEKTRVATATAAPVNGRRWRRQKQGWR